jgi:hypothetical protein
MEREIEVIRCKLKERSPTEKARWFFRVAEIPHGEMECVEKTGRWQTRDDTRSRHAIDTLTKAGFLAVALCPVLMSPPYGFDVVVVVGDKSNEKTQAFDVVKALEPVRVVPKKRSFDAF